jgi:hypothetical protein
MAQVRVSTHVPPVVRTMELVAQAVLVAQIAPGFAMRLDREARIAFEQLLRELRPLAWAP